MNYDVLLNRTGLSKLGLGGQSNEASSSQQQRENVRNASPTFIQSERDHSNSTNASSSAQVASANATPSRKISYFSMFDSGSPSTSTAGQTGKVETKLLSMWHNMKYGWSGKMRSTSFSKEQPIILLGKCYHRRMTPPQTGENSLDNAPIAAPVRYENSQMLIIDEPQSVNFATESPVEELGRDAADDDNSQASNTSDTQYELEGIESFKRDFVSRLWMTYRREFPLMNDSNYTSDCGWGCMIRSGQMLLAQGLVAHLLGRDWRWDADTQVTYTQQDIVHRKIIKWFGDSISKSHPFSIHTLVQLGKELGKKPGDWWGPGAVAILLRNAVKLAAQEISDLDKLNVYVAQDCAVYIQDILDECLVPEPLKIAPWQQHQQIKSPTTDPTSPTTSQGETGNFKWKSLILLVPLRLGTEKMNLIYGDCLKAMLSLEHCIGIIGGRPKHSLFFVGYQEDKLIHLDPHYCQDMVDVNQDMFSTTSFHCRSPRKMKLTKMDPCCCIGFYCATKNDFDRFVSSVQPFLLPARTYVDRQQTVQSNDCNYPMFVFCRGRNTDQHHQEELPERIHYSSLPTTQRDYDDDDDEDFTEEFVFLEK